jgi:hypothetical protein
VTASSSRRQSGTRIASADSARTGRSPFTGVRQYPSKTGWVVTQLVTQAGGDHRCGQGGDRLGHIGGPGGVAGSACAYWLALSAKLS